jgi:UDP-N-acetylglucosamine acyltransferase
VGADERAEAGVHATAIIDPDVELADGVTVGPYSVLGPGVTVGAGTEIGAHVFVEKNTILGEDCLVAKGAVLGSDPQDLKFRGEETTLEIGDRTVIREYATLNRGTAASGKTVVGSDCLLMAYTHVAHDCEIGNHVIVSNATQMAGHVLIEDWAIVSGLVAIHQFVRIGAHSFIGGGSRIPKDVPPYCRAVGNPDAKLYGLNTVGLDRRGLSSDVRKALKQAYRILFQSGLNISQGLARAETEVEPIPEVRYFIRFIRDSERGITV